MYHVIPIMNASNVSIVNPNVILFDIVQFFIVLYFVLVVLNMMFYFP